MKIIQFLSLVALAAAAPQIIPGISFLPPLNAGGVPIVPLVGNVVAPPPSDSPSDPAVPIPDDNTVFCQCEPPQDSSPPPTTDAPAPNPTPDFAHCKCFFPNGVPVNSILSNGSHIVVINVAPVPANAGPTPGPVNIFEEMFAAVGQPGGDINSWLKELKHNFSGDNGNAPESTFSPNDGLWNEMFAAAGQPGSNVSQWISDLKSNWTDGAYNNSGNGSALNNVNQEQLAEWMQAFQSAAGAAVNNNAADAHYNAWLQQFEAVNGTGPPKGPDGHTGATDGVSKDGSPSARPPVVIAAVPTRPSSSFPTKPPVTTKTWWKGWATATKAPTKKATTKTWWKGWATATKAPTKKATTKTWWKGWATAKKAK